MLRYLSLSLFRSIHAKVIVFSIFMGIVALGIGWLIGFYMSHPQLMDATARQHMAILPFLAPLIDLNIRIYFQRLPSLSLRSLYVLPISTSRLALGLLLRSCISMFNLYPLMIGLGMMLAIGFSLPVLVYTLLWVCFNQALWLCSNRFMGRYSLAVIAIPLVLTLILGLSSYWPEAFRATMMDFLAGISNGERPMIVLALMSGMSAVAAFLLIQAYHWNRKSILNGEVEAENGAFRLNLIRNSAQLFHRYPNQRYFSVELLTIFRIPKIMNSLLMGILAVAVVLLKQYMDDEPSSWLFMLFGSHFFVFSYGFFAGSWDSQYYPALQCVLYDHHRYLQAKLNIIRLGNAASTLLLLPIVVIYFPEEIFTYLAIGLFATGLNSMVCLYRSLLTRMEVDLSNSSVLMENTNAIDNLLNLVVLIAPLAVVVLIFDLWGRFHYLPYIFGSLGILGFLLTKPLIQYLSNEITTARD
jgi:hypothetical protein